MACSVFEVLAAHDGIDQDDLAFRFGARYRREPGRGYGGTAHEILDAISRGASWREVAVEPFGGQGSMGNGSAMRVAPVGGYFAEDLDRVVHHAKLSGGADTRASRWARRSHRRRRGGGPAWQMGNGKRERSGQVLLREVGALTPAGSTRDGLERAATVPFTHLPEDAAKELGNGSRRSSARTRCCPSRSGARRATWTTSRSRSGRRYRAWETGTPRAQSSEGHRRPFSVGKGGIPAAFSSSREPLPLDARS